MFEKGDIVECVDVSIQPPHSPLVLGRKYIVQCVATCNCSKVIDIGYRCDTSYGVGHCPKCMDNINKPGQTWWFMSYRFRKIEPEYRTVEISESINKQVKELVYN